MNLQTNQVKTDFLNKIRSYFEENNLDLSNKSIAVCLSGGADSVSLLISLIALSKSYSFSVCAMHFNHMIRGAEADRDEEFCKSLCAKYGVKLYRGRDDVPAYATLNKLSLEAAARECRYNFFERICKKYNIDYCATAHNMNDDAETLILNLIRGSGSNGSSAIAPVKGNILRPLLKIKRNEIESYISACSAEYITDSTNNSIEYTRNLIRHTIIPKLEEINPAVIDAIAKFTDSARTDRDYFESIIYNHFDSDLRELHPAIRDRVIIAKFNRFSGKLLNKELLMQINKTIFGYNHFIVPIYNEFEAVINNGTVSFYRKSDNVSLKFDLQQITNDENYVFGDRVEIIIDKEPNRVLKKINKLYTSVIINSDNISGVLSVRNRLEGDKILINGMHKSIKKLFIEKKVPKEYRDIIPIILDTEGIVYVPFVGVADKARLTSNGNTIQLTTVFNTIDPERWNNAYEK